MAKRKGKIDLSGAFSEHTTPMDIDPQLIDEDSDLSEDQLFKKYVPRLFPPKIAKHIMGLYPDLKCNKHSKIRKITNKSLILFGEPGTGKSFMACMAVLFGKKISWAYLSCHVNFITVPDLLTAVRTLAVTGNKEITETGRTAFDEYIQNLKRVRYLILDDLGTEKQTDFASSILDNVINHRYELSKGRHTIITTNLTLEQLKGEMGHARILSRIVEVGIAVKLTKLYRISEETQIIEI